jgi:hypothetical protein
MNREKSQTHEKPAKQQEVLSGLADFRLSPKAGGFGKTG